MNWDKPLGEHKICIDCAQIQANTLDSRDWSCKDPRNSSNEIDLITGKYKPINSLTELRRLPLTCGPKGNWFISAYEQRAKQMALYAEQAAAKKPSVTPPAVIGKGNYEDLLEVPNKEVAAKAKELLDKMKARKAFSSHRLATISVEDIN